MAEPAHDMPLDSEDHGILADRPPLGVGLGGACPTCKAPLDVAQAYCLECGAPANRFPRKPQQRRRAAPGTVVPLQAPQRRFPWIPLTIVVLLIAGGITYALMASDADKSSETPEPTESAAIADELTSTPGPSDADESDTSPTPEPAFPDAADEPTTDESGFPDTDPTVDEPTFPDGASAGPSSGETSASGDGGDWPAGKSGYTLVLASYAKDTYPKSTADDRAVKAQAQGLESGVIDSDQFSSMSTGYWVVYAGVYESRSEAEAAVGEAKALGNMGVYAKEVK